MTPKEQNTARVRRYRARHRRLDYVPAEDVMAIIERQLAMHLRDGLDNCLAGVLDRLVRAGDEAITGNGGKA